DRLYGRAQSVRVPTRSGCGVVAALHGAGADPEPGDAVAVSGACAAAAALWNDVDYDSHRGTDGHAARRADSQGRTAAAWRGTGGSIPRCGWLLAGDVPTHSAAFAWSLTADRWANRLRRRLAQRELCRAAVDNDQPTAINAAAELSGRGQKRD